MLDHSVELTNGKDQVQLGVEGLLAASGHVLPRLAGLLEGSHGGLGGLAGGLLAWHDVGTKVVLVIIIEQKKKTHLNTLLIIF